MSLLLFSDAELAQKQMEVALASSDIWFRLRWGIADWLPWIVGIAVLAAWWQWGLTRCPRCRRRFPKHLSGHVTQSPTLSTAKTAVIKLRCRGCSHEWETRRSIFRKRPPGYTSGNKTGTGSSAGSSRPFKGFGGGSSGGGGSTRGY